MDIEIAALTKKLRSNMLTWYGGGVIHYIFLYEFTYVIGRV